MTDFSLSPETTPGRVVLAVPDLDRSLDFYQNVLGFRLHHQEGQVATLGAGQADLLELQADPSFRRLKGTTGLYHFAILVPTRRDLAFVLRRIAETETPVSGFADHLVSEAIYLPDPDGNGIEIYCDRPSDTWRGPNGNLRMGTEPLDLGDLLAEVTGENPSWDGLPTGTRLGHVNLHVADLEAAIDFYREALGLDLVMRYGPGAAFLSAGGYHHHVGINTWNGEGAP
ncbi:MAG: VOC family protein, partial [Anaerolineales bacterium]|nr:VOC family protein [Anaerolineales bacterium]